MYLKNSGYCTFYSNRQNLTKIRTFTLGVQVLNKDGEEKVPPAMKQGRDNDIPAFQERYREYDAEYRYGQPCN